jgi:hypothetical protein
MAAEERDRTQRVRKRTPQDSKSGEKVRRSATGYDINEGLGRGTTEENMPRGTV